MQRISEYYGRFRSGEKITRSIRTNAASKMKHEIVGSANDLLRRLLWQTIVFNEAHGINQ